MDKGLEKKMNIPGMVNRLPEFSYTIPLEYRPLEGRGELSDDELADFLDKIVEPCVAMHIGEVHNDIDLSLVKKPSYGKGDYLVSISVKKHADHPAGKDYYKGILDSVIQLGSLSKLIGLNTMKDFLVQGHNVQVPAPPTEERKTV